MVKKPSGRYKRRDQENELAEQPRDSEQASKVAARDQVAPPEKPTIADDPADLDEIVSVPDLPAPNDLRLPAGSEELGIEGRFDLDHEVWTGDHKLPDGDAPSTHDEVVDRFFDAVDDNAPPEKNLDGAAEDGSTNPFLEWFSGKSEDQAQGLAQGTAASKFDIVDLPGMGEKGSTIPHGEALNASAADDADGNPTPSEAGMPELNEEEATALADKIQETKETTPAGETATVSYKDRDFVVKGEKEDLGEGAKDYVDGETGELFEPTEGQQQYMQIQTEARLGSEMNPVRTDDLLASDPLPDVGDDVNARPTTPDEWEELHSYDGPVDVADTIPDGGVIDPVEFEG